MLTRPQLHDCLLALGFTVVPSSGEPPRLTYAGIQVQILDAPRLTATFPHGEQLYLAVASAAELEAQLTELLGYRRPTRR